MDFTDSHSDSDEVLLNVNGCDDAGYRYKMPPINAVEQSFRGGSTVITNVDVIAAAIYRTSVDLKKFYAKELGLSTKLVDTGLFLPVKIEAGVLQEKLQKYINKNVLCAKCKCPETPAAKKGYKCQACGFRFS